MHRSTQPLAKTAFEATMSLKAPMRAEGILPLSHLALDGRQISPDDRRLRCENHRSRQEGHWPEMQLQRSGSSGFPESAIEMAL
jgi:hypothetical protein